MNDAGASGSERRTTPGKGKCTMINAIIRKIVLMIPLLLIVSMLMFLVVNLLPGNAADMMLESGSLEQKARLEAKYGLDQPIYVQYYNWVTNFLRGDMGKSILSGQAVTKRIAERLPTTLELILFSMTLAILVGIPAGVISAVKRNTLLDYTLSTISMAGIAVPSFWLGILMILLLSVKLNILPASGYASFSSNPVKNLTSMIMPSVCLAVTLAAPITRQTRSAMLDTLSQDYILTAQSKGLRPSKVILKHALRNALVPVITAITSQIGKMIGGVFVIETLFLLPGMGKSMVDAIFQRDYPIIMATAMVVVSSVMVINLLTDIVNIIIDPRIRSDARK